MRRDRDHVMVGDLPSGMAKLRAFRELLSEEEIGEILGESYSNSSEEIDFETFLRVRLHAWLFFLFRFSSVKKCIEHVDSPD